MPPQTGLSAIFWIHLLTTSLPRLIFSLFHHILQRKTVPEKYTIHYAFLLLIIHHRALALAQRHGKH